MREKKKIRPNDMEEDLDPSYGYDDLDILDESIQRVYKRHLCYVFQREFNLLYISHLV